MLAAPGGLLRALQFERDRRVDVFGRNDARGKLAPVEEERGRRIDAKDAAHAGVGLDLLERLGVAAVEIGNAADVLRRFSAPSTASAWSGGRRASPPLRLPCRSAAPSTTAAAASHAAMWLPFGALGCTPPRAGSAWHEPHLALPAYFAMSPLYDSCALRQWGHWKSLNPTTTTLAPSAGIGEVDPRLQIPPLDQLGPLRFGQRRHRRRRGSLRLDAFTREVRDDRSRSDDVEQRQHECDRTGEKSPQVARGAARQRGHRERRGSTGNDEERHHRDIRGRAQHAEGLELNVQSPGEIHRERKTNRRQREHIRRPPVTFAPRTANRVTAPAAPWSLTTTVGKKTALRGPPAVTASADRRGHTREDWGLRHMPCGNTAC